MGLPKRKFIFQLSIFRGHISFRAGINLTRIFPFQHSDFHFCILFFPLPPRSGRKRGGIWSTDGARNLPMEFVQNLSICVRQWMPSFCHHPGRMRHHQPPCSTAVEHATLPPQKNESVLFFVFSRGNATTLNIKINNTRKNVSVFSRFRTSKCGREIWQKVCNPCSQIQQKRWENNRYTNAFQIDTVDGRNPANQLIW